MVFGIPLLRRYFHGLAAPHDEHLLAGADQASVQALGVSQPILARFSHEIAVLCPDLLHETQIGMAGK